MIFGLCNAAQTFQRFINQIVGLDFCKAYIDDILVASVNEQEHQKHLRLLFQRLRHFGIVINSSKCVLGKSQVTFLGHLISAKGISPMPEKVQTINYYPEPKDQKSLKRFLGMINYYHRFIRNSSELQIPLQFAVKNYKKGKCKEIVWSEEMHTAFNNLKNELAKATLLAFPKKIKSHCHFIPTHLIVLSVQ